MSRKHHKKTQKGGSIFTKYEFDEKIDDSIHRGYIKTENRETFAKELGFGDHSYRPKLDDKIQIITFLHRYGGYSFVGYIIREGIVTEKCNTSADMPKYRLVFQNFKYYNILGNPKENFQNNEDFKLTPRTTEFEDYWRLRELK